MDKQLNTSLRSAWPVFIGSDNCDVSSNHWIQSQQMVTSRIDYCKVLLVGTPKAMTDKLQRLLNAAARLVSDARKFSCSLRHLMHGFIGSLCQKE